MQIGTWFGSDTSYLFCIFKISWKTDRWGWTHRTWFPQVQHVLR